MPRFTSTSLMPDCVSAHTDVRVWGIAEDAPWRHALLRVFTETDMELIRYIEPPWYTMACVEVCWQRTSTPGMKRQTEKGPPLL
jgi:hypothetical protein